MIARLDINGENVTIRLDDTLGGSCILAMKTQASHPRKILIAREIIRRINNGK